MYATLDAFLNAWAAADRKQAILEELASQGVFLDELAEQVGLGYDAFELVCHVVFDQTPLTRRERVERVRKRNIFGKYGEEARAVLNALLEKYADGSFAALCKNCSMDEQDSRKQKPLRQSHSRHRGSLYLLARANSREGLQEETTNNAEGGTCRRPTFSFASCVLQFCGLLQQLVERVSRKQLSGEDDCSNSFEFGPKRRSPDFQLSKGCTLVLF